MSRTEDDYARLAAESRARQGLPPHVTDGPALDRLAALIRTYTKPAKPRRRKTAPPTTSTETG
jgi:hypothetical protein